MEIGKIENVTSHENRNVNSELFLNIEIEILRSDRYFWCQNNLLKIKNFKIKNDQFSKLLETNSNWYS